MADFEFKAPASRRPLIASIVTGVVVLILVIILIWAIVRHFHKTADEQPSTGAPSTAQNDNNGQANNSGDSDGSPNDSASSGSGGGSSTGSPDSSSNAQSGSSATPKSPKDNTGSQLADTGPGDVVALFVGATLIGAAGYQVVLRCRSASVRRS